MLSAFLNIFKIPDLRKRVIYTLLLLIACRVGAHVPTPGVNPDAMAKFFQQMGESGIFGMINLFSGGALQRASVFALGIMPYISASIILQLLTAVVPSLEKLAKEGGEEGRKKINQYTRYGTVLLCIVQGYMMSSWALMINANNPGIVLNPGMGFRLMAMITMTTGTMANTVTRFISSRMNNSSQVSFTDSQKIRKTCLIQPPVPAKNPEL